MMMKVKRTKIIFTSRIEQNRLDTNRLRCRTKERASLYVIGILLACSYPFSSLS